LTVSLISFLTTKLGFTIFEQPTNMLSNHLTRMFFNQFLIKKQLMITIIFKHTKAKNIL